MNKKKFLLLLSAQTMCGLVATATAKPQIHVQKKIVYLLDEVQALCDRLSIKTILDIGCLDFWMRKLDMPDICYIGVDNSLEKLEKSQTRYGSENHTFLCADPLIEALPQADMIVVAHLLQGNNIKTIKKLLRALKKTGTVFLMMPMQKKTTGITHNMPKPFVKIEGYNEETGNDEAWGLWLLQEMECDSRFRADTKRKTTI